VNNKTSMEQCLFYDNCNAPICPLAGDDDLIWFPSDGPICKREDFQDFPCIKMQRKIKQARKYSKNETYTKKELEKLYKLETEPVKKATDFKPKKKISNHLKKFIP